NLTEDEICHICRDQSRDTTKICIVEEVGDIILLEKTGQYQGLYHVLGGLLSPIENIGPDELRIPKLMERVRENTVTEVIVALNPTVEGESTAMYIKKQLTSRGVKTTMLASGLPVGGDLEYADEITIGRALSERREI
ncbi:MAG: recombination mediator RecR, partial [Candidatus Humimicrobiaceae bacterium]